MIKEIIKLTKEVKEMIVAMATYGEDISRVNRIAANPTQATVKRCQTKRSVRSVSRSLLNILADDLS
jgi:hypothetical protein